MVEGGALGENRGDRPGARGIRAVGRDSSAQGGSRSGSEVLERMSGLGWSSRAGINTSVGLSNRDPEPMLSPPGREQTGSCG